MGSHSPPLTGARPAGAGSPTVPVDSLAARAAPDSELQRLNAVLDGRQAFHQAQGLLAEASGVELGPEAAFIKLLMTRTEQELYGLLKRVIGVTSLVAPLTDDDLLLAQEYFFSKIVTVYGGSREMQLITIARHKLGLVR